MPSHREDFPLLRESKAIYIDSAATAQRPDCVIQAEADFYARHNANPLRGFYELGVDATQQLETARDSVRDFLHAADSAEIIFTRNTTESLNLVAYSYALTNLCPGDEVVSPSWSTTATCSRGRWPPSTPARPSAFWNATRTAVCRWSAFSPLSRTRLGW